MGVGDMDINATWARTHGHGSTSSHFQLATVASASARYSHYTSGGPGWTIVHKRFEIWADDQPSKTLIYRVINPSALDTDSTAIPRGQISFLFNSKLKDAGVTAEELMDIVGKQLQGKNVEHLEAFKDAWTTYL